MAIQEGMVACVNVHIRQKEIGRKDIRVIKSDAFTKLFGGKAQLRDTRVVMLNNEQLEALENGSIIPIEELGAFDAATASLSAKNKALKADVEATAKALDAKNEQLEAALAEIAKLTGSKEAKPETQETDNTDSAKDEAAKTSTKPAAKSK